LTSADAFFRTVCRLFSVKCHFHESDRRTRWIKEAIAIHKCKESVRAGTPDLTFYCPAMTSSFSMNQLILMEMTLHGVTSFWLVKVRISIYLIIKMSCVQRNSLFKKECITFTVETNATHMQTDRQTDRHTDTQQCQRPQYLLHSLSKDNKNWNRNWAQN